MQTILNTFFYKSILITCCLCTFSTSVFANKLTIKNEVYFLTGNSILKAPNSDSLSLEISENNFTCYNSCEGSIELTVLNGTPPFEYSWSSINIGNEEDPTDLCFGEYSVTVTDANQCTASINTLVDENPEITGALVFTGPSCSTACNGTIDATIGGGTAPYTYEWSTGETTEDVGDLCEVIPGLTVTDARGCMAEFIPTVIIVPTVIKVFASTQNTSCPETCDGYALIEVSGGEAPYTFDWSEGNYDGLDEVFDICAGFYEVTVTDAIGCSVTTLIEIEEPHPINIQALINPPCFGECDGSIHFSIAGGTPPYQIDWIGGQEMLCAGDYSITVTDANACSAQADFTILESPEIIVTVDTIIPEINLLSNGAIEISVEGGTFPYEYNWTIEGDNGSTFISNDEDPSNLPTNTYQCEIIDANGCTFLLEDIIVDFIIPTHEPSWAEQILVSPNPFKDQLTILFSQFSFSSIQIEIFNVHGVSVLQKRYSNQSENLSLNIHDIPAGIYTLRLSTAEKFFTFKIIKL